MRQDASIEATNVSIYMNKYLVRRLMLRIYFGTYPYFTIQESGVTYFQKVSFKIMKFQLLAQIPFRTMHSN